jgi:hypothetical protein
LINVVETLSEANKLTGEIINHAGAIKSIMIAKLINRFIKFPPLLKLESLFYIKSRILKIFHRVFEFVKVTIAFLIPLPSADLLPTLQNAGWSAGAFVCRGMMQST